MFVIQDGRECFYQWDLDRKIIVKDSSIKQVHFCNKTEECSLVCATYEKNGETLVDVPNILLTTDWKINVFGYTGDYTKHSACFKVVGRSKPSDYVYTETEILNFEHLQEEILAVEQKVDGALYDLESTYIKRTDAVELIALEADAAIRNYGAVTEQEVVNIINEQEKQYELINSFTLTEETKTIELDGFELDKYVLYITSPKSDVEGGCSYRVYKGETQVYNAWVNLILSKADNGTSMLSGKNENGMGFIEAATSNYSYKTPVITPQYIEGINPFTKIRLIMNTTSAYNFQVGTKFELWGVRR